jgi:hypothetical protein
VKTDRFEIDPFCFFPKSDRFEIEAFSFLRVENRSFSFARFKAFLRRFHVKVYKIPRAIKKRGMG